MKKTVKLLKYAGVVLLWLYYSIISQDARLRYSYGKRRGMYCSELKNDMFGTDLTFLPGVEPVREYMTYREFFQGFGFYKGK